MLVATFYRDGHVYWSLSCWAGVLGLLLLRDNRLSFWRFSWPWDLSCRVLCWRILLVCSCICIVLGQAFHSEVFCHGEEGVQLLLGHIHFSIVHEVEHRHKV